MSTLGARPAAFNGLLVPVKHGARHWWASYAVMLRWHLASLRVWMATLGVIQVLSGVGFILGISLFFGHIPMTAALFVSTGVPVVNLVMVGLVMGPQLVADQKINGSYDYLRSLPVSRSVTAAAWYTVCLMTGIPAMVVSLCVARWRYDLPLHISPMVVPAVLLTSFAGTMLGYALGHAIGNPMATRLITQLLVFVVFGFAPVLFPLSQMPRWLGALNWWFPFRHMAVVTRAALTSGAHPAVVSAYVVLGVWTVACAGLAGRALGRRP
ncbi:MAG: ABC transporter permease [Acidimicrobiales bacterium]